MSDEQPVVDTTATAEPKTTTDEGLPEAKKQKTDEETMTSTKKASVPESPDSEWPEAWYMMEDGTYEDQKERNRLTPNKPASVEVLRDLGIAYWKMDAENFSYPPKAIPWDPKDATDPKLQAIRDDRKYGFDKHTCFETKMRYQ